MLQPVFAMPVGRATAPIENARPAKTETAWGRLAADAVRDAARADVAWVHAGVLQRGTLAAGAVEDKNIAALLAFPDDEIATLKLNGAQLRAALERAASSHPTASPAMLHVSGIDAAFNADAPAGKRLVSLRTQSGAVRDADVFQVAMPISLAQGGAGYFAIWDGAPSQRARVSLRAAIANRFRAGGDIAPDETPRFRAQ